MQIYHYDHGTGEYIGTSQAQSDPLAPDRFLIPAHATRIAPPQMPEGKAAVFAGGAWSLVNDQRSAEYWLVDGTRHQITVLGDTMPDGALDARPPPGIEDQRSSATATVQVDSQSARMVIAAPATSAEIAAWPYKAVVAQKVIDNIASDTEIAALQTEADARGLGETVSQLAALQLQRADAFYTATSALDGAKRAALAVISTATGQAVITEAIKTHRSAVATVQQSLTT